MMDIKELPKIFYRFIYLIFIKNLFYPIYVLFIKLIKIFKSIFTFIRRTILLIKNSNSSKIEKFNKTKNFLAKLDNLKFKLNSSTSSNEDTIPKNFTFIISNTAKNSSGNVQSIRSNRSSSIADQFSPKELLFNEYKSKFLNDTHLFKPSFLLRNPLIQFLYKKYLCKYTKLIGYDIEYFDFNDDNTSDKCLKYKIALNWAKHEYIRISPYAPILIIIPDLLTGFDPKECCETYKNLCLKAIEHGYRPCVYLNRYRTYCNLIESEQNHQKLFTSAKQLPPTSPPPPIQIFDDYNDLQYTIDLLHFKLQNSLSYDLAQRKKTQIFLCAYGTGTQCVFNLIASKDSRLNTIDGCVCVSPIFNLKTFLSNSASDGVFKIYFLNFLKLSYLKYFNYLMSSYRKLMRSQFDECTSSSALIQYFSKYFGSNNCDGFNLENNLLKWKLNVMNSKTLLDFILRNDVKMQNFSDINEYLRNYDFEAKLNFTSIQVPCLCISSLDDPLNKPDNYSLEDFLPIKFLNRNKESIMMLPNNGSYCTFIESSKTSSSWCESVCLDYFFKLQKHKKPFTFF